MQKRSIQPNRPLKRAPERGSKTNPGVRGKPNQDSLGFFRIGPGGSSRWREAPEQSIFVGVVADGVTSESAGATASTVAIRSLQRVLAQTTNVNSITQRLEEGLRVANQDIVEASQQSSKMSGMSTTIVAAVIDGWRLYIAHVGDSRAYLIRGSQIHRLTLDHTWVQQALDTGRLTEREAQTHTNRHTLLHYLGNTRSVQVDHEIVAPGTYDNGVERHMQTSIALEPGDMILLCSDGVTDKLRDRDILRLVQHHGRDPRAVARALIDLAVKRREEDNITAALIALPSHPLQRLLRTGNHDLVSLLIMVAILSLLLFSGWWLWSWGHANGLLSLLPLVPVVV